MNLTLYQLSLLPDMCVVENVDEDVAEEDGGGAGDGGDVATRLARDMEALTISSYCTPLRSQQVKGGMIAAGQGSELCTKVK